MMLHARDTSAPMSRNLPCCFVSGRAPSPDSLYFSGVLRPPVDGIYLLTTYVWQNTDNNGELFLKRNDEVLCAGNLNEPAMATCTAVAVLFVGDSVRVTGLSADPALIKAGFSGFAGHIINS